MPRSSRGSSRSSSSFARAPAPAARAPPPPAKSAPPPAPTPAAPAAAAPAPSGGMLSGIGSTIMQGMAFGTGSAIAHQAVGAVARSFSGSGSSEAPAPTPQQTQPAAAAPVNNGANGPCAVDLAAFNRCMKENDNNVTSCDFYYNALQQCQTSSHY